jgi:hypothetical protein
MVWPLLLILLGGVLLVAGVAMLSIPAALMVAGVALAAVGLLIDGDVFTR